MKIYDVYVTDHRSNPYIHGIIAKCESIREEYLEAIQDYDLLFSNSDYSDSDIWLYLMANEDVNDEEVKKKILSVFGCDDQYSLTIKNKQP